MRQGTAMAVRVFTIFPFSSMLICPRFCFECRKTAGLFVYLDRGNMKKGMARRACKFPANNLIKKTVRTVDNRPSGRLYWDGSDKERNEMLKQKVSIFH